MKTTNNPSLQIFHLEGVKHISPNDALESLKNGEAVMIDVRELNEVQLECIPLERVINHPMSVIVDRLSYIAKDQQIIVGCPGGVRSVKVASLLSREGYPDVASLDGGFTQWKANGLPWELNPPFGGCGCNSEGQTNTETLSAPMAALKKKCEWSGL